MSTEARQALEELVAALDAHLNYNDYCGLEVSKHHAGEVSGKIEAARAALTEVSALAVVDQAQQVADLAMTVRMLCSKLKKHEPDNELIKRAMEYQREHGLSSPLRSNTGGAR